LFFQFQPTRKRGKTAAAGGMDPSFDFSHFSNDIWSEKLPTLVKKKKMSSKTTLDDKIRKRMKNGAFVPNATDMEIKEETSSSSEDELHSDDSLSKAGKSKIRKKTKKQVTTSLGDSNNEADVDDIELSDDELKEDTLIKKDKKGKGAKKKKKQNESEEDEVESGDETIADANNGAFDTNTSFQQMNLSRPLLKVYNCPVKSKSMKQSVCQYVIVTVYNDYDF